MEAKELEKEQVCGFLKRELREKIETAIDLLFKKENCGYSVYEMGVCVGQIDFHIQEALLKLHDSDRLKVKSVAKVKDAECQAKLAQVKKDLEEFCPHKHPFQILNKAKHYCEDCWQERWKGLGIE